MSAINENAGTKESSSRCWRNALIRIVVAAETVTGRDNFEAVNLIKIPYDMYTYFFSEIYTVLSIFIPFLSIKIWFTFYRFPIIHFTIATRIFISRSISRLPYYHLFISQRFDCYERCLDCIIHCASSRLWGSIHVRRIIRNTEHSNGRKFHPSRPMADFPQRHPTELG